MNSNLIAQSEPINISKENKIEVVSTLIAYPLVLNELDLTNKLLTNCKEINEIFSEQINVYKKNEILYKSQIKVLEKQTKLFDIQLKKEKLNKFKIAGVGVLALATAILIK